MVNQLGNAVNRGRSAQMADFLGRVFETCHLSNAVTRCTPPYGLPHCATGPKCV
jgi:hypothetical protein